MDEKFEEYTQILDTIKQTEAEGQSKAEEAIEGLKLFIRDNRICAPDAFIDLEDNELTIKTSENYSTTRLLEIEEFTGFSLHFKDQGLIVFKYR